jgi:squalene synthase HpnC
MDNSLRIEKLNAYEHELDLIENARRSSDPVFVALADTIKKFNLPVVQFRKLLSAFKQDVTKKHYNNFTEILDYCDRSANPVGFLLLNLVNINDPDLIKKSNAVCSALQLINFLQDINVDYKIGRIYLPMDEMESYNINESYLDGSTYNKDWRDFIAHQLNRAELLLREGSSLGKHLGFRLGTEINLTVAGGMRVIKKLKIINNHSFIYQARLNRIDWLHILINTIKFSFPQKEHQST